MRLLTSKPVLAVVALVAVLVVALVLVLALTGGGGGGGEADEDAEPTVGRVGANDLRIGDCITDAGAPEGDVTTFNAVTCDRPHNGEVYTLIELEGGKRARYPGTQFVTGKGQRGCRARLRRQLTRRAFRDRELGYKYVYPTKQSWADGDREVTCIATFTNPRRGKLEQRRAS